MPFVDNLRVLLISLVVVQHLSVTYGATGSWYYRDPAPDAFTSTVLTMWNGPGQAAGMGLFFGISAYLTPGSYDRKGARAFLRDRLVRLGIPMLTYVLLLDPLVVYVANGLRGSYWSFLRDYLLHLRGVTGPVWFLAVLLLFTFLYAAWRALTRHRDWENRRRLVQLPSNWVIMAFIVGLGVVTFLVRIWWPVYIVFGPLNVSVGYLPQYVSMYALGLLAFRGGWLSKLSPKLATDWSLTALLTSLVWLGMAVPYVVGEMGRTGGQLGSAIAGGAHWLALGYALWEAFLLVGASIGLLVLFRERCNQQGRLVREATAAAYTVYLIHPLVLVPFCYAFASVALFPLLKFFVAVLITLPLCYLVSSFIRRVPVLNRAL